MPGFRAGEGLTVAGLQLQGHDVAGLRSLRRDPERAEAAPRRRWTERRQPCVPSAGRIPELLVEERLQRPLPARAERRDAKRAPELLDIVTAGEVEERVDVGDRHRLGPGRDPHHVVARLNVALFEHAEVEARTAVGNEERSHARLVHPDPDPIAGDPRLGDLEERRADAIPVADADLVVAKPLDREVLAELAEGEVVAMHLVLPVPVRVELVHVHGPLLASVTLQIALAVTVDVQTPDGARSLDRLLPDSREDGPPLPRDLPRQPDVDRDEPRDSLRHRRTSLDPTRTR